MRKLSAHYILTGTGAVLAKGIITLTNDGVITEIIDTKGELDEKAGVEFYSGVLVPGFVNAHCHLELSHLYGIFPEKTGLPGFLKNVIQHRNLEESKVIEEARKADLELWKNGIVAVGDVSNTDTTFKLKSGSKIAYHTFIEALGFSPQRAERAFGWARHCFDEAQLLGLPASVVPHAPYSISKALFEMISEFAESQDSILSMHSQECSEEDDLYLSGAGEIVRHLTENLTLDLTSFKPTGKSALESVINWLPINNKLLLVHNISIDYGVMEKAKNVYVLCADFGWSDLGTWGSLYENHKMDGAANAVSGNKIFLYDTKKCIINMPDDKIVVIQGLKDFIVVESDKTLLICKKEDEQQIRQFVADVMLSEKKVSN